jgi:acetyl-CoA synthetase
MCSVYGPLALGATTFMFEGTPLYPDAGRYWSMVHRHKINIFYTAPTAIRALMRFGTDIVKKHDRSSLRILGSVGEPINPEAWKWYYEVVGDKQCAVVDTFWQTETGGHMITPLPITPTKPGSATLPFFGVKPVLLESDGKLLENNDARGVLCFGMPWPGQARTITNDHQRFFQTYFASCSYPPCTHCAANGRISYRVAPSHPLSRLPLSCVCCLA